jgi:hypothetical protein
MDRDAAAFGCGSAAWMRAASCSRTSQVVEFVHWQERPMFLSNAEIRPLSGMCQKRHFVQGTDLGKEVFDLAIKDRRPKRCLIFSCLLDGTYRAHVHLDRSPFHH